jgi:hypothetical protein
MDIEAVHLKYKELSRSEVVKKGDTTSFAVVDYEIKKIYEWENDYYKAGGYRRQLPEDINKSIINEFNTIIDLFIRIQQLRNEQAATLLAERESLISGIKNLYKTLYGLFVQDYRAWRVENEGGDFIKQLETRAQKAEENLSKQEEQAVTNIVGTETTEEWAREYSQYIDPDKKIISRVGEIKRRYKSLKERNKGKTRIIKNDWLQTKCDMYCFINSKVYGVAFYSGHSYLNNSYRWRFWRSIFYIILAVISVIYLIYFFVVGAPDENQLTKYFLEKLAFLPLIVVMAIGLAFAGKNYRINAKLLEDYKHRYVVAKTIQNLLLLPDIKKNIRLQTELLTIGASILFEPRASGYMGNDEEEKLIQNLISQLKIASNN